MLSPTINRVRFSSLAALLLVQLLFMGVVSAASLTAPQRVIQDISDQLQAAINSGSYDLSRAYTLANDIVVPHIDFKRVSSLALGKHWRQAKPAQKREFIREFKRLLVRTYATAFYAFKEWDISHMAMRQGRRKGDVFVRTKVLRSGAKPVDVEYRMYKSKGGSWKVYNLKIEGVSLITNYRSQFQQKIRSGGLDGLIQQLKSKNDVRTAAL